MKDPEALLAIRLYQLTCGLVIAFQSLIALGGYQLRSSSAELANLDPRYDIGFWQGMGSTLIALGILFALSQGVLLLLPRRPWAYGIHFANAIGAAFLCIPTLAAIPTIVLWMKPRTKEYFGA